MKRLIAVVALVAVIGFAALVWGYNRYIQYETSLDAWPAKEVGATAPRTLQADHPGKIRILSLDGGGVRGLISLEILKHLEEVTGKPIAELFDVVAGTSTGGIIGTQLLIAAEDGKPIHAANDIIEEYDDMVRRVFSVPWYHRVLTLGGLLGPRYTNHAKVQIAEHLYADANFRDLLRPAMVPAYSVEHGELRLFNNWSPDYAEMFIAPLISAATSGPTLFPGVELTGLPEGTGVYMDGATLGNDPAQLALLQVLEDAPDQEIVMVSIGTGTPEFGLSAEVGRRGGLLDWLRTVFYIGIYGDAELTAKWLESFAKTDAGKRLTYYRFDTPLPPAKSSMSESSAEHIAFLKQIGKSLVSDNKDQLDEVIQHLTQP